MFQIQENDNETTGNYVAVDLKQKMNEVAEQNKNLVKKRNYSRHPSSIRQPALIESGSTGGNSQE